MKKALVLKDGRIAEIANKEFPVHPDLKWIDVPDDTSTMDCYINAAVTKFVPPERPARPNLLSVEVLATALVAKGVLTSADLDTALSAESKGKS
jgi:hypothetical protein